FFSKLFGISERAQPAKKEPPLEECFKKTLEKGDYNTEDWIYYTDTTDNQVYQSKYIGGYLEVEHLQDPLFIRLQRDQYRKGIQSKITDMVDIPSKFRERELKGFVRHQGGAHGG